MLKRPKPSDTEDDILRLQQEFMTQRAKNPQLQAAAQVVKFEKPVKQSLFAKSRLKEQEAPTQSHTSGSATSDNRNKLLDDINEKIVGDVHGKKVKLGVTEIVLGDIHEKQTEAPSFKADVVTLDVTAFPKITGSATNVSNKKGKSIFARSLAAKAGNINQNNVKPVPQSVQTMEPSEFLTQLTSVYGNESVIVEDNQTAREVHAQNLNLLSQMREEEIMAERQKLLDSIDPALVALLAKKRQAKAVGQARLAAATPQSTQSPSPTSAAHSTIPLPMEVDQSNPAPVEVISELPASNPAQTLIQRSSQEHWLNFDVVEKDKLEWMRDIPDMSKQLKPGEKFEARFDWKGVLLPYSLDDTKKANEEPLATENSKDERELYLHGAEPNRPGYTLQELFRLARSNILQQRVSAFGAIAGILNIYNQGFYDQVLELPISKMFFLLRFGLDDNTPAQLEIVSKALAYLFYNETDETLLDYMFENSDCHWQPILAVLGNASLDDDTNSIEFLQKQMKLLQMQPATISANVEESEEDSRTSMSDFQLAETDLIDCLLRTNIFQRIYFILNNVRPNNSTVSSCLKLLIRIARSGKQFAEQLINEAGLMECLMNNFLPSMSLVDTNQTQETFYNYPQYLCLKLIRVLIAQHLNIAMQMKQTKLMEIIQNYLYISEDIRHKLILLQIEALRILRCFLLLRIVEHKTFKQLLPALRKMLDLHYNHLVYEIGGPTLVRRHAAALLATISACAADGVDLEVQKLLGEVLHDCCCKWLHRATNGAGVKEYSQATLLNACLNVLNWYACHGIDAATRLRNFHKKYLPDFVRSQCFIECVNNLSHASIILRSSNDRRNVHAPLPNTGAVLMNQYGPQLVLTQSYSVQLLTSIWSMLELQLASGEQALFEALIQPAIVEPLVKFLRAIITRLNRFLATNFFARSELKFVHQLLCFEGFSAYLTKSELFKIVYNYLCCLSTAHAQEIKQLFERYIFNEAYVQVDSDTLKLWRQTCLSLLYKYIVVAPREPTLTLPATQMPILPNDWPYFQLGIILKNYVENKPRPSESQFSEQQVLGMTLNFVSQLESDDMQLHIVSPTEKLMYLMIAFMGPESQFLDVEMQKLLRAHILQFYKQCGDIKFDFDATFPDKCKFEHLYALFVDHFQAASYGDELFSSLVLIPLAQKYDNKWRRRLWSDYASALRFLNCDESLLLGGLQAYLEPVEQEISLLKAYTGALQTNLVREGSIPYKIAKHHVDNCKPK